MHIGLNTLGLNQSNLFGLQSLFTGGETGALYEPLDPNSVYQDSAGTTAGVIGNPVGLRLDKSLGAVRGAELSAPAVQLTPNAGTAIDNGDGSYTLTSGGQARLRYTLAELTDGMSYEFGITVLAASGANQAQVDWCDTPATGLGVAGGPRTVNYVGVRATYDSTYRFLDVVAGGSSSITFRLAYAHAVPGNHATQATSTSRPLWKQDASGFLHDEFDGADDYLTSATGGGGSAGFFYCAAIYVGGGAGTIRTLWSDRNSNSGYQVRLGTLNRLEFFAFDGTTFAAAASGNDSIPVGETHIVTAWDDGTNLKLQIDNGAIASTARPVVVAGTASYTVGRDNGASSGYFPGRIYNSVYRKDSAPDAATRELVKRRIAASAGITL